MEVEANAQMKCVEWKVEKYTGYSPSNHPVLEKFRKVLPVPPKTPFEVVHGREGKDTEVTNPTPEPYGQYLKNYFMGKRFN